MIRQPAVAGQFYPNERAELSRELDRLMPENSAPVTAGGLIVPHAGYVYSGAVAGELIAGTIIPQTVILIGPNHHGAGANIAVSGAERWRTPLGDAFVDDSLRQACCEQIPGLIIDDRPHRFEHSLEVILPFLLRKRSDVRILPISIGTLPYQQARELGTALSTLLVSEESVPLLLASSDMNHFLDATTTQRLDQLAIAAMLAFDSQLLYTTVREHLISMCGVLPAIVVMTATKQLGAQTCELVRYAHSGQVNGDNSRVVGYAALRIQ